MKKLWMVVLGLVVVLAAIGITSCSTEGVPITAGNAELKVNMNSQEGIWVNGTGKVNAVPDVAILSLGIQAQADTVDAARTQASNAMDKVMAALKAQGVADKDIQTQYFNIQQQTQWDNQKGQQTIIGYQVTNTVTAKVRDIEKAGAVIDAVATAGGDLTRINSIGFTVDDPTPYYAEARQKAAADAEAKAQQLADVAGVKLGKPIYITENINVPGPIYRQDMVMAAPAPAVETPISAGEQEITLNIQINYEIVD